MSRINAAPRNMPAKECKVLILLPVVSNSWKFVPNTDVARYVKTNAITVTDIVLAMSFTIVSKYGER